MSTRDNAYTQLYAIIRDWDGPAQGDSTSTAIGKLYMPEAAGRKRYLCSAHLYVMFRAGVIHRTAARPYCYWVSERITDEDVARRCKQMSNKLTRDSAIKRRAEEATVRAKEVKKPAVRKIPVPNGQDTNVGKIIMDLASRVKQLETRVRELEDLATKPEDDTWEAAYWKDMVDPL